MRYDVRIAKSNPNNSRCARITISNSVLQLINEYCPDWKSIEFEIKKNFFYIIPRKRITEQRYVDYQKGSIRITYKFPRNIPERMFGQTFDINECIPCTSFHFSIKMSLGRKVSVRPIPEAVEEHKAERISIDDASCIEALSAECIEALSAEIDRLREENESLKQQIVCYEDKINTIKGVLKDE